MTRSRNAKPSSAAPSSAPPAAQGAPNAMIAPPAAQGATVAPVDPVVVVQNPNAPPTAQGAANAARVANVVPTSVQEAPLRAAVVVAPTILNSSVVVAPTRANAAVDAAATPLKEALLPVADDTIKDDGWKAPSESDQNAMENGFCHPTYYKFVLNAGCTYQFPFGERNME